MPTPRNPAKRISPETDDVEVDEELGDDDADVFLEEDEDEDDELGFDVNNDEDP